MYGLSSRPVPRRGRPPEGLNVRINITVTPAQRAWLQALDMDISAFVRGLIDIARATQEGRAPPPAPQETAPAAAAVAVPAVPAPGPRRRRPPGAAARTPASRR